MSPVRLSYLLFGCMSACAARPPITQLGATYPEGPAPTLARAPAPRTLVPLPTPAPADSPPRSSSPDEALPGFGSAPFAGQGPMQVEATGSAADWVALCRARELGAASADALVRFLVTPSEELPIDAFLLASRNGRYVLFMRAGTLELWDAQTRASTDLSALGADARLSAETGAAVRTLDFDVTSEHLLYVREQAQKTRIVVRTLADGTEQELDPGAGKVWRASFAPGGVFVSLQMVSADTNRNGRLDFPYPWLHEARACGADSSHFHSFEARGDVPETVLLPRDGGLAVREPDLLMPVGHALLLRDEDGALWLSHAGKKRLLEPAECQGRIVYADPVRELFIVSCAQKKKSIHVDLELVSRAGRRPLKLEQSFVDRDREVGEAQRLVALYPGADTVLLDADRRELIPLQAGDSVVATAGPHALVRRGKALFIFDAATQNELPLAGEVDRFPIILRAAPFAFVSPMLVDVAHARVVGSSRARPLALSATGQLLLAASDPDGATLARGPLHWVAPANDDAPLAIISNFRGPARQR